MMIPKITTREAFLEAVIHDRHIILGREMHPFCLDHWCLLDALDSPLLRGGEIKISDLQLAVQVCSTGNDFEFYDAARRPHFGWRLWSSITRNYPIKPTLIAFNRYIEDYVPQFPRWKNDDFGDELKCPALFVSAAKWIDKGHPASLVRRMGLGELMAWNLAIDESKGDASDSLMNESDIEALKAINSEDSI